MPTAGDRFSSQNMSDCSFCPPEGRRFRTSRQCASCAKPLCLVCRPDIPGQSYLCPECGGGAVEGALGDPEASIRRIEEAGLRVPYWLVVAREYHIAVPTAEPDELIIPE